MRQADQDEIYNVLGHNNPFLLARQVLEALSFGSAVVAFHRGQPAGLMGFAPIRLNVATAIAFGTDQFKLVAHALTRHALRVMKPALLAAGFHRLECESRHDHVEAHRWLEFLGFKREGLLRKHGCDGSDYIKYAATNEKERLSCVS